MAQGFRRIDLSDGKLTGAEQIMQRPREGPKAEGRAGGQRGGKPIAPGADGGLAGLIGAECPEYRRAGGAFCGGAVT